MAKYRQIHVEIWDDPDFQKLTTSGKLIFIYLFSNYKVGESGIYNITFRKIAFDTSVNIKLVEKLLTGGIKNIFYDIDTSTVFIAKHRFYNRMGGAPDKIAAAIANERIKYKTRLWGLYDKAYDAKGDYKLNPSETLDNGFTNPSLVSIVSLVNVLDRVNKEFKEIRTLLTKLFTDTDFGLPATRKHKKIAPSVLMVELDYYAKYDVQLVGDAVEIYLDKGYATERKKENYLRGIIRELKEQSEAFIPAEIVY